METRKDNIFSKVYSLNDSVWPDYYKGHFIKKTWLNIEKGEVMWGYRVIIPNKLRLALLKEIHSTHTGIAKIKMLTRSYYWWPRLNRRLSVGFLPMVR